VRSVGRSFFLDQLASRPGITPCIQERTVDFILNLPPALVVLLRQIVERKSRLSVADTLGAIPGVALLACEQLQTLLEVTPNHSLSCSAIRTDDVREKVPAHQWLHSMLLLGDDL